MAKDAGFDLAAMLADLSDVPDSGTGREQIEYIDISLLDDDPNNFYELRDLEMLAANIATCGLQQPIRVRKSPDIEGRYIIVSGHRRRAALELLVKDDTLKWSEAPCIVERDDVSPELQELRLIYANAHTRQLTPAEISDQAVKVEQLLYKLEEQGYPFPGRMRDHVAKAVGVNKTKLSNLKVIRDNLHRSWQPVFKAVQIGESVALALARMPGDWQFIMFMNWQSKPTKLCHDHVTNAAKKFEVLQDKKCDRDCRVTCWANRARLDYIAGMGMYDSSCSGCCWTCSKLVNCQWCCTVAESQKKHLKQVARDANAAAKAKEQERIQPVADYIRGVYARWSQAKCQADLDTAQYLKTCGAGPYNDAEYFEKYELHPEKINAEQIKLPFAVNIWPGEAQALCKAADVLGCSIDWLLGRDVPAPIEEMSKPAAGGWQTGYPPEIGEYVVCTKVYEGGAIYSDTAKWNGAQWVGTFLEPGEVIFCWMPMPEEV